MSLVSMPLRRRVLTALLACVAAAPAAAQDYGDTPYVQTPQVVVDRMLEVAKVGPTDYVIDLGSGDGRMVITAARRFGARGFGVDLDGRLVTLSNRLAAKAGVAERAAFFERDIYQTDLTRATVVTMYLLPEVNLMMRPRLLAQLSPGSRVVSHDYGMGEWKPDLALTLDAPGKSVGREAKSQILHWIVPANAAGRWVWRGAAGEAPLDFELAVQQSFQSVEPRLSAGGQPATVESAQLTGDRLALVARLPDGTRYELAGRISGNALDGTARLTRTGGTPRASPLHATRTEIWEPLHLKLPPPSLVPPQ